MRNDHTNRERSIREKVVERLSLPGDVCLGELKVTMFGNREVWVENYRGILEYSCCGILLQGKQGRLLLEGKGLFIDYYTGEIMKIGGRIMCVRFL